MTQLNSATSQSSSLSKSALRSSASSDSAPEGGLTTAEKLLAQRSPLDQLKEQPSALDAFKEQSADHCKPVDQSNLPEDFFKVPDRNCWLPPNLGGYKPIPFPSPIDIVKPSPFPSPFPFPTPFPFPKPMPTPGPVPTPGPTPTPTPGEETDLADPTVLSKHDTDQYEYRDTDGELFVNGISADDVVQGAVGDCYLMGALASLAATNPDFIRDMIVDNGDGTFTVNFAEPLGPQTVDDDLLFRENASGPTYAKVGDAGEPQELWVAIVEKAYAQAKGGYQNIEGGWPRNALAEITGNSDFTAVQPEEMDFSTVEQAVADDRPVNAATYGGDKTYDNGLVGNHVYTILETRVVDGVEQVRLRNPWGRTEVGTDGVDDGAFWMDYDDFQEEFRMVSVMNSDLPNT